ncbi:MAG: DUF1844 domain-containing protein [Nitrospira sp.]
MTETCSSISLMACGQPSPMISTDVAYGVLRKRVRNGWRAGFVIRDKRGSAGGGCSNRHFQHERDNRVGCCIRIRPTQHQFPCITFSSFVISLGSSSLMLMGEQLDPQQAPMPVGLPQAKEIIDLLSVLDDKTKVILTSDEQTVLRDMLYAHFV